MQIFHLPFINELKTHYQSQSKGGINLAVERTRTKQKTESHLSKGISVEIEVLLTSYTSKPYKPHSLVMHIQRLLEFIPQSLKRAQ